MKVPHRQDTLTHVSSPSGKAGREPHVGQSFLHRHVFRRAWSQRDPPRPLRVCAQCVRALGEPVRAEGITLTVNGTFRAAARFCSARRCFLEKGGNRR